MDWSNESYVRLYTKDTPTWRRLKWQGQAVLSLLLRKIDQSGVMDGIEDVYDDVSIATGLPIETAKEGLDLLLKYEVFAFSDSVLFMPNFLEAQTASKSDKQRQRESRDNRKAKAGLITKSDSVSRNVTKGSRKVTKSHSRSRVVTGGHSLLYFAYPLHSIAIPLQYSAIKADTQAQFETFWKFYPNKNNKKKAKLLFGKLASGKDFDFNLIISALKKQTKQDKWTKDNGDYVPLPTTWLNGERWHDELPNPNSNGKKGQQGLNAHKSWEHVLAKIRNSEVKLTDLELAAVKPMGGTYNLKRLTVKDLSFKKNDFIGYFEDEVRKRG